MFKDSDPPVSLFSFQDIVTTLIGIMILFVLLLSLELMETTRTFERNSPVMEELKQLRERRRSLEARSEEMSRRLETLANELDAVGEMSEAEMRYESGRLRQRIATARATVAEVDRRLLQAREAQTQSATEAESLSRREQELEERRREAREVQSRGEALRVENLRLREEIRKKRNAVSIEFEGDRNTEPILVECGAEGFRWKKFSSPEVHGIRFSGETVTDEIGELLTQLGRYPASGCYILFLIKPGGASYAEYLFREFSRRLPTYGYGMDPLLEKEFCF